MQSTWFHAYFNGLNYGTYRTIVNVNGWEEAHLELIMWIIATLIIIYGSYLNLNLIYKVYGEPKTTNVQSE
jgi:hypothetical protein